MMTGGLEVERSLGVRKVATYQKSLKDGTSRSLAYARHRKSECLEIWLVGPVSAYNVTGWGAPVKCLRQERSSVAAL